MTKLLISTDRVFPGTAVQGLTVPTKVNGIYDRYIDAVTAKVNWKIRLMIGHIY